MQGHPAKPYLPCRNCEVRSVCYFKLLDLRDTLLQSKRKLIEGIWGPRWFRESLKLLMGPRTWSLEPMGHLGGCLSDQALPSFDMEWMSPAGIHHHQVTQQTTTATTVDISVRQRNQKEKQPGYSLQISFMMEQNRIHFQDNNNPMEESLRVYKVFYICDGI